MIKMDLLFVNIAFNPCTILLVLTCTPCVLTQPTTYLDSPNELEALHETVSILQQQVSLLQQQVEKCSTRPATHTTSVGTGVTYVNWGRKSCPKNTSMIYTGHTAKAHHLYTGGGIDYQCLPPTPDDSYRTTSGHQEHSYIYGVEYWAFGLSQILPNSDRHNNVPCSVCEATSKRQTLMIPAKRTCPSGWSIEYEGYLMAEKYNHINPSTFICIDKNYEYLTGGVGDQPSGYVVPVELHCGIIPCPPYGEGRELSCVVCSK